MNNRAPSSHWPSWRIVVFLCVLAALHGACRSTTKNSSEPSVQDDRRIVILISLDGFRWDQLDFPEAQNLRQLWQNGVRAEGLIPVFPSKTFPNHYSIATGLYPNKHGIVSNNIRDADLGEFHLSDRDAVQNSGWWFGEPIWVTAELAGLRTAAMFWPGTETAIRTTGQPNGVRPGDWRPYDGRMPFEERTTQVLEWLAREPNQRPHFITLYFSEPDSQSHRYGPESTQAHEAIKQVDEQIGALVRGIADLGLDQKVDLVITSDHGMVEVSDQRLIPIEELVSLEDGELFESGAFVQIFPKPGREKTLLDTLIGAHPELSVFHRDQAPQHYRVHHNERLAPILAVPTPGWEVVTNRRLAAIPEGFVGGHHGPDPRDPRLHGIFLASGSSFARGSVIPRFENVHIYELLCQLLKLQPATNDGDPQVLRNVLRGSPTGTSLTD